MTPHLSILDPLRALAAVAVACYHFAMGFPRAGFSQICSFGDLGVPMFFVISGLIIPYSLLKGGYRPTAHFLAFVWKRVLRLHPAFLASALLTVGLWYGSALATNYRITPPQYTAPQSLAHPLLLNGFLKLDWFQPVYWTLAIEFQFYLLCGALTGVIRVRPWLSVTAALAALTLSGLMASGMISKSNTLIVGYLPIFLVGLSCCGRLLGKLARWEHLTLCAAGIVGTHLAHGPAQAATTLLAAVLLTIQPAAPWKWATWLGKISYSIYLVHIPIGGRVVAVAKKFPLDTTTAQVLTVLAALTLSIIGAAIFHRLFEAPFAKLSSKLRYA
jgi:peptidoglycan/LPS O-acetylase OafA/YrhL